MLVELSAPAGSTAVITTPQVYRNMTFSTLSTKQFDAEISLVGITAMTGRGGDRDVFLEVAPHNLPDLGDLPVFLNSFAMGIVRLQAQGLWPIDPDPLQLGPAITREQRLRRFWPTYDVHAYYETFRLLRANGVVYKWVSPMYPFTYFFDHAGALFGFTSATAGLDVALSQPTKNVFKVRIPSESKFHVRSGVTANEVPKSVQALAATACYWFPWACGINAQTDQ
jgi:hypothetical protein